MARQPKAATGTDIATLDEELAALAGQATALTNSEGGGKFFSTRAGVLSFGDTPLPGNQMCVIVTAWMLENVYYEADYDPDNPAPPTCYAFCKDPEAKDEMAPDEAHMDKYPDAFTIQNPTCDGCPQNEWGSSPKGRGKACSNRRRVAVVPAGTYTPVGRGGGFELEVIADADHFRTAEEAFIKLPVMSCKGFDNYVKDIAEQFKKPLFCAYTRVFLTPDPKSQFRVNFELIEMLNPRDAEQKSIVQALMERSKKIYETIDSPYVPMAEDDKPAAKPANKKLAGRGKR